MVSRQQLNQNRTSKASSPPEQKIVNEEAFKDKTKTNKASNGTSRPAIGTLQHLTSFKEGAKYKNVGSVAPSL